MAADDTVELEISEEDIVRYLTDEAGNEIGIVVLEDGKEVQYLYADDDDDAYDEAASSDRESSEAESAAETSEGEVGADASKAAGESDEISYKKVQGATDDMNAIFKDGVAVANEFKGAFDDIKSALDFKSWLK